MNNQTSKTRLKNSLKFSFLQKKKNSIKIFGFGCDTVYDLTPDGANLWLAGITAESKAQVNYYTTEYDAGGLFGNGWCDMVMNSVLVSMNCFVFLFVSFFLTTI